MVEKRIINAPDAPQPGGGYSQAVEVSGMSRLLHISGQIPVNPDGTVPDGFTEQCRLAWANVEAQLRAAGMGLDNLVKVTTFLSDRRYADENGRVRRAVLDGCKPALTVIITGIYDEAWLLEIEAVSPRPEVRSCPNGHGASLHALSRMPRRTRRFVGTHSRPSLGRHDELGRA